MGVDFSLRIVRKQGKKIIPVKGKNVPHAWCRVGTLQTLIFAENVEELLDYKAAWGFFWKSNTTAYGGDEGIHYDPDVVLRTLHAAKNILIKNQDKMPVFYWFCKDDFCQGSPSVFINGRNTYIRGGFDGGYYFTKIGTLEHRVDISKLKEIKCREVESKKEGDKWVEIEGKEVTYTIKKQTFYHYFKKLLNELIKVCNYAKKHGYYVHGYYS